MYSNRHKVIIRNLGLRDYTPIFGQMQTFTKKRQPETIDELWVLEHTAVFTQGQAGKAEHILDTKDIPIVQSNRGGQVTYHGPGQLIVYLLIDLKRKKIGVRELVTTLERSVISFLQDLDIIATTKATAPGVYVNETKICSLGLRVSHGCSYHGLALNVDMDLEPFTYINPCGYNNLKVSQISDLVDNQSIGTVADHLLTYLMQYLSYTDIIKQRSSCD